METYVIEDNAGYMHITRNGGETFTDFNTPDRPDGAGIEDMTAYHECDWSGDNEYRGSQMQGKTVAGIDSDGSVVLYPESMGFAAQYCFDCVQ